MSVASTIGRRYGDGGIGISQFHPLARLVGRFTRTLFQRCSLPAVVVLSLITNFAIPAVAQPDTGEFFKQRCR